MGATRCPECHGSVIEYSSNAGNGFCVNCGTVVEENTIVSEVTFGETSSGAAAVQGSYVAQGATGARMGGRFGQQAVDSRQQVIENGRRRIAEVANAMNLQEHVAEAAQRWFNLCITTNFIKGRRTREVAAVCLYIACRINKSSRMLIDFSVALKLNVFDLGAVYLKAVQTLNIQLPAVDPAHYINRFAALLEFGADTRKVAEDATRLVARFDRDWMRTGRRPSGICGACLLLAARMNNYRRSVQEIVQVVKIADTTVKKRLEEFKKTPSGKLTISDFRTVQLEEEADPPAFTRAKEKSRKRAREDAEVVHKVIDEEAEVETSPKRAKTATREDTPDPSTQESAPSTASTLTSDPTTIPLFLPDLDDDDDNTLFANSQTQSAPSIDNPAGEAESLIDQSIAEEVSRYLSSADAAALTAELSIPDPDAPLIASTSASASTSTAVPTASSAFPAVPPEVDGEEDELQGLDEEELDMYMMTPDEVTLKTRLWVEFNKDYLEKIAAKGLSAEDGDTKPRRKKRKAPKPRDSTTPQGATPAESARLLLQKKKFSRRINYKVVDKLFADSPRLLGEPEDAGEDKGEEDKADDGELMLDPELELELVEEAYEPNAGGLGGVEGRGDDDKGDEDDYYDNYVEDGYQEEV